jgi:outer membrane biosynthesis protein TonB
MVTAIAFPVENPRNEKLAKIIAWIVTALFAVTLLILLLIKIITPIPAIPPDPEAMTLEIGLTDGTGGDAATQGGGSNGNTGVPGMQNPSVAQNVQPKNPADGGTVTDPNSTNAATSTTTHTGTATTPTVDPSTAALMSNWNKTHGKASINIGGDGKGDPYTGGLGNGSGSDKGPGAGDPGTGGPGGQNGTSALGNGNRVRHILSKPEIVNPTQEEGKVVVNVYIDRTGHVTKTEVKSDGTTTMNSVLRSTATQSAYKIVFDADPNGPVSLVMPIDIYFTLK